METSADGTHRIIVRRHIPAPREIVYEAWIDPEGLRLWMCPGDVISAEATLDVRVGGSFHIRMKSPDRIHQHTGNYTIVQPPAKLAFTWHSVENPTDETLVTVEFIALGDESELVITHERLRKSDIAERYEKGWGTIEQKFAAYLDEKKRFKTAQSA